MYQKPNSLICGLSPSSVSVKIILLVEDEILIAMQHEAHLTALGYAVVVASELDEAIGHLSEQPIHAALVDYRLHRQTAEPLIAELQERQIPLAVVTSYPTNELAIPLGRTPIVSKPCEKVDFERVLSQLEMSTPNNLSI